MEIGTVAHLFYGPEILLVLRDSHEGVIDAGCWDSITETMEEDDCGNFTSCMKRGLIEEISLIPERLHFLGLTRAGHGFFVGFISREEVETLELGHEGQELTTFTLDKLGQLRLGGAVKNHLDAYPEAFEELSRGIVPKPEKLNLRQLVTT